MLVATVNSYAELKAFVAKNNARIKAARRANNPLTKKARLAGRKEGV